MYLQKFKVEPVDYDEKSSTLKSLNKATFYAFWKQGVIEDVFIPHTKDSSLDNFLRAIVSLFQYQLVDGETIQEDDISGTCEVKYVSKSSTKYMKYKSNCVSDLELHQRFDKPLGISNRFTRVNVISVSADGHLESIHSTDHHKFSVNAYPNVGFIVGSLFYLKHDGKTADCKILTAENYTEAVKSLVDVLETTLLPAANDEGSSDQKTVSQFKIIPLHH